MLVVGMGRGILVVGMGRGTLVVRQSLLNTTFGYTDGGSRIEVRIGELASLAAHQGIAPPFECLCFCR